MMAMLGVMMAASAGKPADGLPRDVVLLVGTRVEGYEAALRSLDVPYRKAASLDGAGALSPDACPGVIVAASDYPHPTVLTAGQREALEGYVRGGGRALVEYAKAADGGLFGVTLGDPVMAQHERIAYLSGAAALPICGLAEDDLLEEHHSRVLPASELPADAAVLLSYGRWVGTYTVYRGELRQTERFEHNVTIDLGQPTTVASISARFGGEEPNYCPDRVTVAVCDEHGRPERELGTFSGPWKAPLVVNLEFAPVTARYIRLATKKRKVSAVTDFLMLGEIEVRDEGGRNAALGRPYRLEHFTYGEGWHAGPLTDGLIDGPWSDGRSVKVPMVVFGVEQDAGLNEPVWPGLIRRPLGRGEALLLTTQAGDFRAHHYRLTEKWEALCRSLVLAVLPEAGRRAAQARYVPLKAHTWPRAWARPDEPVRLVVRAPEDARLSVSCPTLAIAPPASTGPEAWEAIITPAPGHHRIAVVARTATGQATTTARLWVAPREEAYRRALDRNMRWYLKSGVMPAADATQGVMSAISIPAFGGGPVEDLPSHFRADCQAMTLEAFGLYSRLAGDATWLSRARALGDILVNMQFRDPAKPSFGARPWLFERDESIWADDSQRNASALIALYGLTGDTSYLRSALSWVEMAEQISKEDATIGWGSIQRTQLDKMHRSGFRELQWEPFFRYDMLARFDAWRATGDPLYRLEAERIGRFYADTDILNIAPPAYRLTGDPDLKARVDRHWREYLADPDVQRVGAQRLHGGEFRYAFFNDCSINTGNDPLTDQLYSTGWQALSAWRSWKATGSGAAREAALRLCDYFVRIQSESPDPRVDGAWFRGFDFERWEVYGAGYDPNYGPYHAYTGWMESIIDQALAMALLDTDPLEPLREQWSQAAPVLAGVRAIRVPDPVALSANIAERRPYTLSPAPDGPHGDDGRKLVDGTIDGRMEDGESATWRVPEPGKALTVEMTVDLGEERRVAMVGQRYGALDPRRLPDTLEVLAGPSLDDLRVIASRPVGAGVRWSAWKVLPPTPARYVRLRVTKHGRAGDDYLAIGETTIYAAAE